MLKLKEAELTVKLTKSEFGWVQNSLLGQLEGQGQIRPVDEVILVGNDRIL